jgi:hypothetical protein
MQQGKDGDQAQGRWLVQQSTYAQTSQQKALFVSGGRIPTGAAARVALVTPPAAAGPPPPAVAGTPAAWRFPPFCSGAIWMRPGYGPRGVGTQVGVPNPPVAHQPHIASAPDEPLHWLPVLVAHKLGRQPEEGELMRILRYDL